MDDFVLTITSRIDKAKADEHARLDAERERIRAEEQAKAEAKVRAETAAREAQEREEAAAKAKADAEAAEKAAQSATQQAEPKVTTITPASAREAADAIEKVLNADLAPVPAEVLEQAPIRRGSVSIQTEAEKAVTDTSKRPTDKQIIFAVATVFNTDFHTALGWIAEINQTSEVA